MRKWEASQMMQKDHQEQGQPNVGMAKPIKTKTDVILSKKESFMYRGQNADRNGDHEDQGQ